MHTESFVILQHDYFKLTGCSKFPLPFVATRWVEDKGVSDRFIELWDSIKKVFDFWKGLAKSKRPKSKSYELGESSSMIL